MELRKSDYESYDYREFWENDKRKYEDRSERIALRKLFKKTGNEGIIADIGCGFGRLFTVYENFEAIIMFDYSMCNLKNAKSYISSYLKEKGRLDILENIFFVSGDANNLPFKSGVLSAIISVRLTHHLNEPKKLIGEASRTLKNRGLFILEFANKRNIKNILKYAAGRSKKSPFDASPLEIGDTIRDNHPKAILKSFEECSFRIIKVLSVSNFRLGFFKKKIKLPILLSAENISQNLFSFLKLGPSIFVKALKNFPESSLPVKELKNLEIENSVKKPKIKEIIFCPFCRSDECELTFTENAVICPECAKKFQIIDGIIDFRAE